LMLLTKMLRIQRTKLETSLVN